MRRLGVLLLVEGASDEDFLPVIVQRALEELCRESIPAPVFVDVTSAVVVNGDGEDRHEWIVKRASDEGFSHLVALHLDGTGDVDREMRKYFAPVEALWPDDASMGHLLAIVPVHEMESWALADRHVLEDVVGVVWKDASVFEGDLLERPESLSDPKRTLREIVAHGVRPRRRVPQGADYLPLVAERLPVSSLRRLPSFAKFQREVVDAMKVTGWRIDEH